MTIFSHRELQVIKYFLDGYHDTIIAQNLGINNSNVREYKSKVRKKIGLTRSQNDHYLALLLWDYFYNEISDVTRLELYQKYSIDTYTSQIKKLRRG